MILFQRLPAFSLVLSKGHAYILNVERETPRLDACRQPGQGDAAGVRHALLGPAW